MTEKQTPAETEMILPIVGPGKAMLLSLMLPGLGQLFTGKIKRGLIMVVGITIWFIWAVVTLITDLNKVLPGLIEQVKASGEGLSWVDVQQSMSMQTGITSLSWLFLPLIVIWVWSIADSFRYFMWVRRVSK